MSGFRPRSTDCSEIECQGPFDGGSVGGTPQSGTPLGRWMRFGSQSSSARALNLCKDCIRIPMKEGENQTQRNTLL